MIPYHFLGVTSQGVDATMTLNDYHLATPGLTDRRAEAVAAVSRVGQRVDGACWIDVAAPSYPTDLPGGLSYTCRDGPTRPNGASYSARSR